jgi:diaminobutyrate-2-oxoglutarate transaminase
VTADGCLERQRRRESNARTYPRALPITMIRGEGLYVTAADGRVYLDCLAGAGTLTLGHNHPEVTDAIRAALDSGVPLHTLDFPTPLRDEFVEELYSCLPAELAADARIQFCGPAGTDAVEAALKLVEIATGRRGLLAFRGGYHGMTRGALAVSGVPAVRDLVTVAGPPVHFLPYPYGYRCPFGLGGEAGARACVEYLRRLLEDPASGLPPPAGLIVEVVQGEGGCVPAPDEWLRSVRELTSAGWRASCRRSLDRQGRGCQAAASLGATARITANITGTGDTPATPSRARSAGRATYGRGCRGRSGRRA